MRTRSIALASMLSLILFATGCPMGTVSAADDLGSDPASTGGSSTIPTADQAEDTEASPSSGSGSGSGSVGATSAGATGSVAAAVTADDCDPPLDTDTSKARIFELVNEARAAEGLGPVSENKILEAQAEQYACEMIVWEFFAHENPVTGTTLGDRAREFGYNFAIIGENLAAGQRTAEQAMQDWLDSPGHRANILEPDFTELGVGIRLGGPYGIYWVQEFGHPRAARRAPISSN